METNEANYEVSFQIIMNAGDAQDAAMKAITFSNENRFEDAEEYIKKSKEALKAAHNSQTDLMVQEANGNPVAVNPILIHAYDHYTMALMALDMAKMALEMNRKIADLQERKAS
jgi:cellobiose-specific phosphotransferase system component IIA